MLGAGLTGGFTSTFCFLTGVGVLLVGATALASFSGKYKTGLLLITAAPTMVVWSALDWEEDEENPAEGLAGFTPALWSCVGRKNVEEGTEDGLEKNFG